MTLPHPLRHLLMLLALAASGSALAQTGVVSGQITDARNGSSVANSLVILGSMQGFPPSLVQVQTQLTGADGRYQFTAPAVGLSYVIRVEPPAPLLTNYWPNYPCQAGASCLFPGFGNILLQPDQQFVADVAVSTPGSLSGRVTRDSGGAPIAGINIRVGWISTEAPFTVSTVTNAAGEYRIDGLTPGGYRVVAGVESAEFAPEIFDNIQCLGFCGDPLLGTPVVVSADMENSTANFGLGAAASVSGVVQEVGMTNITQHAAVRLHKVNGSMLEDAGSVLLSPGESIFEVTGLPAGDYVLSTDRNGESVYVNEVYDDRACAHNECTAVERLAGDRIQLTAGASRSVMLELEPAGSISGCVTDAQTDAPLAGVDLVAYREGLMTFLFDIQRARTGGDGCYRLDYLPAGDVRVRSLNRAGYIDQIYQGIACLGGSVCPMGSGDVIALSHDEDLQGFNMALQPGASISGEILYRLPSTAATGAEIEIYTADGFPVRLQENAHQLVAASGQFHTYALADGSYYLAVRYRDRRYVFGAANIPEDPFPPPNSGQLIAIDNGQSVDDILFVLDPDGIFDSGFE